MVVKLIKRGPEYSTLVICTRFSGVSGAIDEALVALEHGGYIALPTDYSQEWWQDLLTWEQAQP